MTAEGFDAIAYLNDPSKRSVNLGLDRVRFLLAQLGDPQDQLRFVHVAGTNGKGSISSYTAGILRAAGYRVGLFTSPYIFRFEERIQVDGQVIPLDDLTAITLRVRDIADAMDDHPTEFELITVVAFAYFAQMACDIVVLEVGLGGRWDATNVIAAPEVCVMARMGLDHTAILGDTIELIAGEKAAIIKPGAAVVSYPQEPGAAAVIEAQARACGAAVTCADLTQLATEPFDLLAACGAGQAMRGFSYKGVSYRTSLLGSYQPCNAAVAIEVARALAARGWRVSRQDIVDGIAATSWPGRFQVIGCAPGQPLVIVDGSHNPQGAAALSATLDDVLPGVRPVMMIGLLADKDYPSMLASIAPHGRAFVTVTPGNPRALSAADLAAAIAATPGVDAAAPIQPAQGFADGAQRAWQLAGPQGVICVVGSLYSIADAKAAFDALISGPAPAPAPTPASDPAPAPTPAPASDPAPAPASDPAPAPASDPAPAPIPPRSDSPCTS